VTYNVPDDWNNYYTSCHRCGRRYHASEGGCGCYEEELEELGACQCGQERWMWDAEEPQNERCSACHTGPPIATYSASTYHTARKPHHDSKILRGQRYRKDFERGYFPGGRFYMTIKKVVIK
jgi:hypothetical protein